MFSSTTNDAKAQAMFDFNAQDKVQKALLVIAGTLLLLALIMAFTRGVMLALIVALAAVLILFISKAVSSSLGARNNPPPDLPERVDDMSRRL